MTKIGTLSKRVSSIFRKRKVAPKTTNDRKEDEEATVRLEETESDLTLVNEESCSFDVGPQVTVTPEESPKAKKSVSFSEVTVRHYELILGDNPYCRFPLGLGWNYTEAKEPVQVDCFEEERAARQAQATQDRIQPRLYVAPDGDTNFQMQHYLAHVHTEQDYEDPTLSELTLQERRARLRAFGYTERALQLAERQRIVTLALQWKDGGTPGFPYSKQFIARYTR